MPVSRRPRFSDAQPADLAEVFDRVSLVRFEVGALGAAFGGPDEAESLGRAEEVRHNLSCVRVIG